MKSSLLLQTASSCRWVIGFWPSFCDQLSDGALMIRQPNCQRRGLDTSMYLVACIAAILHCSSEPLSRTHPPTCKGSATNVRKSDRRKVSPRARKLASQAPRRQCNIVVTATNRRAFCILLYASSRVTGRHGKGFAGSGVVLLRSSSIELLMS